ncbi:L-2-hydroxyglutarate oxidase [Sphingobium nicotianae]|uniref:L-2-hydroxyglutarate oxidase n=1 Tax=Sphingobium nicotianae TaxID=2782607 RepID=A0A9X1D9V6_9SPHN|nr:L-2-hydroxyglutarate oxidase [Sphingobium nicotianae]MBT2186052.1 L-2-hydroxyglutarate oxidase [Sphingobium nicotianae]
MTTAPERRPALDADVLIVGGGIVGVSTAMQLLTRNPGLSIILAEKEKALAMHQSGHNSGVIHAGVYYAPGSLKAEFCRRGADATYAFSAEHGLRTERCGKLIVATNDIERARLKDLFVRCQQNGLHPEMLDGAALRRIEPNITGIAAVRVESSGIADYPAIVRKMAELATLNGADIRLSCEILSLREEHDHLVASTTTGDIRTRYGIVCGGLMADRLAATCGMEIDFRIIPFRGEYFRLPASKDQIVNHLIYPVPDPSLPFLGVHLTRMIDGYVTVGPNAVLAMARQGYRWRDVNMHDLMEMAAFPGFWKMLRSHARAGFQEGVNSVWRHGYLNLCRKYCPGLQLDDLLSYPAGVRAQAVMRDGSMVQDFLIRQSKHCLHVCNAPSPAATSAIPIGAHLVEQFLTFAEDLQMRSQR